MSLPTKDQLGEKLSDYPLLRLLLYERWFRLAFAAFAFIFLALALFLPKIWRTSRPGFIPVIRVSGLDLVQAWSLKRTAVQAAARGDFEQGNFAWQAALANNRADPNLARGALLNTLKDPHRAQRAGQAIQESYWLLKLTGTNLVDLELAVQVFKEYRLYDSIVDLVGSRLNEATPALAAAYLKALFNTGSMDRFESHWSRFEKQLPADPELPLYRAAYLAGWGPPETATAARQQLENATTVPELRTLVWRLKLVLSAHALNVAEFGQALAKLEEWREDTVQEHAVYWRLLAQQGGKAEAAQRAQSFTRPPATPLELVELSQAYAALGLPDQALQLLDRYRKDFGHAPIVWITYANQLYQARRWEQMRDMAIQMRAEPTIREPLLSMSYFLEGRAELALHRDSSALGAFQKAAAAEFPYAGLGQKIAAELLDLNYPELARQILLPLEKQLRDQPSYWFILFRAADRLRDVPLLVRSAAQAYHLTPEDPLVMNNYAAALLIDRQRPDEIIKLTLPLYAQSPTSLPALVNHSAALLLNQRPKEAEALLSRVRTNTLTPAQLALYNLDLFETYLRLEQYALAWEVSDRIESDRLYPTQAKWLQEARRQLPPRRKPNSG